MQLPDDTNNVFPGILQTIADLMSQHGDIRELDGRTLSQCDEELDALQSVQKQLGRRVALVRQKRNTFAPLNALPHELLVTIFEIVIASGSVRIWSDRQTLVLVCRHWNHLFNNTPSLWTEIRGNLQTSNVIIAHALEMSKGSPLEISYNGTDWSGVPGRQPAFLSIIFPHAHRWRRASLWIQGAAKALEPITTFSAPLLESLSLQASGDLAWASDEPLDIFGGRPPPRLQELSLTGIPVLWSPKALCNLKVLKITSIEHLGPSLDQLFAILSASPSLESLSILGVTFSGGASPPVPNPIHMPTLGYLALGEISPWIINRILAAIHAPECKSGSLRSAVLLNSFETLFTPDVSHFFDHIRSGPSASSFYCGEGEVMAFWEGPWNMSLDLENVRVTRRVLDWMSVSSQPNVPAVPLRLTISASDPLMAEDILALMADTEAVHRVELLCDAPLAGALEILATGGWEEGSARKPFPGLEEIFIRKPLDDGEWENLLRVFRSRPGDIEARDGGDRLNPVSSLEFGGNWYAGHEESCITEFKSIHWPNRLEEVQRLLGYDGKLRWYEWMVAKDGTLELPSHWDN